MARGSSGTPAQQPAGMWRAGAGSGPRRAGGSTELELAAQRQQEEEVLERGSKDVLRARLHNTLEEKQNRVVSEAKRTSRLTQLYVKEKTNDSLDSIAREEGFINRAVGREGYQSLGDVPVPHVRLGRHGQQQQPHRELNPLRSPASPASPPLPPAPGSPLSTDWEEARKQSRAFLVTADGVRVSVPGGPRQQQQQQQQQQHGGGGGWADGGGGSDSGLEENAERGAPPPPPLLLPPPGAAGKHKKKLGAGTRVQHALARRLCTQLPGNLLLITGTMVFVVYCAVRSVQKGVSVDASINAFTMPNHHTARAWDGYSAALGKCSTAAEAADKAQCPSLPCAAGDAGAGGAARYRARRGSGRSQWKLTLVFDARGGGDLSRNMLTPEHLRAMNAVEMGLLCFANSRPNRTGEAFRMSLAAQAYLFAGFDTPPCTGKATAREYQDLFATYGNSTSSSYVDDGAAGRLLAQSTLARAMAWLAGNTTKPAVEFAYSKAGPAEVGLFGYPNPSGPQLVYQFGSSDMA